MLKKLVRYFSNEAEELLNGTNAVKRVILCNIMYDVMEFRWHDLYYKSFYDNTVAFLHSGNNLQKYSFPHVMCLKESS